MTNNNINIINPYNPINKIIDKENVENLLKKHNINFPINNLKLYQRSFIHKSYIKYNDYSNKLQNTIICEKPDNCISLKTKSNERLEFLGDGVLELITKLYLYKRFPKQNEGFMTEKKIALVKNEHLGLLAYKMNLHDWFIISKNAEDNNIRYNYKKLGCLFEAFLGAIFLDFGKNDSSNGFKIAQIFVENIYEKYINWQELLLNDTNYKNILQIKIQKEFKVTPQYIVINQITDYDNNDTHIAYEIGVYLCIGYNINLLDTKNAVDYNIYNSLNAIKNYIVNNNSILILLGKGLDKTKKKAEQKASKNALNNINII